MTTWFIVTLIIFGLFKIFVTSLPTPVVNFISSKFELHPTLKKEKVTISFDGKIIEGEEKQEIIHDFNEAAFVERHYFPIQHEGIPLMINVSRGKNDTHFSLYKYDEYIEINKQYKKKTISYRVRSKELQKKIPSI